ncbi:MAG TPA: lipid-binding SYLF domain-containing protein [Stellaceae bacterium]|nr:lipid-binding SYLF domain-containing protein [Stellaceae bacterium]
MTRRILLALFALALTPLIAATGARAQSDQQQVVDEAVGVVASFHNPGNYTDNVRSLVHRSRAILIVPNLVKAGFIFGAQGGQGVLLIHNRNGSWSYPAFYNLGAASFGLQIGIAVSKVVLIIMNDHALNLAITNAQLKLGAEAGLAIATLGAGAEGSVTTAGADIYALSNSKGLFGGVAIQGGAIGPNQDWNARYYGRPVTTEQIVYGRARLRQPGANALRRALGRL